MACPSLQGGGASQAVQDVFAAQRGWADSYLNSLGLNISSYLAAIGNLPDSVFNATIAWNAPTELAGAYEPPEDLDKFDEEFEIPTVPTLQTLSELDNPTINEEYPDAPDVADLSFEEAPELADIEIPTDIPTVGYIGVPNAPSVSYPTAPTLADVKIPDIPEIDFPEFDGIAPVVSIDIPSLQDPQAEVPYSSAQLTLLQAQITSVLSGNRGYLDTVWNQIWARERVNETELALEAEEEIRDLWASRGWDAPGGVEAEQLLRVTQKLQSSGSERARTIAIEQNSKEVERFTEHMRQGIQLESNMIQYATQSAARALQMVELFNSAAVALIEVKIKRTNLEIEVYKTKAGVFRDLIQAELLKLEKTEKEIKIASLTGEVDERVIRLYLAKLEAITKKISVYHGELQGVESKVGIMRNQIQIAADRVGIATAQLAANKQKQDIWLGNLDSVKTKASVYDTETKVFTARMGAISQQNTDQVKLYSAYAEQQKLQLANLDYKFKQFDSELRAEQTRFDSLLKVRDQVQEGYKLKSEVENTRVAADANQFRALTERARAEESLKLQHAQILTSHDLRLVELEVNGLEKIMTVTAQVGAAAMAALDVGATIQGNDSIQFQYSYSCS